MNNKDKRDVKKIVLNILNSSSRNGTGFKDRLNDE